MATPKMVTAMRTPWLAARDSGSENCWLRICENMEATAALSLVSVLLSDTLRRTD